MGIKVIIPTDFVTLCKPKLGQKHGDHEESKNATESQPPVSAPISAENTHRETDINTIEAVGEVNWIDLIYDDGTQVVDFTKFINKRLHEVLSIPAEQTEISKESTHPAGNTEGAKEVEGEHDRPKTPEPLHELESKAYILEFGDVSMQSLLNNTKDAMKIFWDGSVSIYPDTFAYQNNKTLTLDLLRIRHENEDRTEPKYSLVHSEETDLVVTQSVSKIKLDEMDNKNADGSMGGGYDESGSMTSTFQHDNSSPAIFVCAEGQFTLKLLQGIENRCLLNMDEHPALTQQQIEDDLAILEEI